MPYHKKETHARAWNILRIGSDCGEGVPRDTKETWTSTSSTQGPSSPTPQLKHQQWHNQHQSFHKKKHMSMHENILRIRSDCGEGAHRDPKETWHSTSSTRCPARLLQWHQPTSIISKKITPYLLIGEGVKLVSYTSSNKASAARTQTMVVTSQQNLFGRRTSKIVDSIICVASGKAQAR